MKVAIVLNDDQEIDECVDIASGESVEVVYVMRNSRAYDRIKLPPNQDAPSDDQESASPKALIMHPMDQLPEGLFCAALSPCETLAACALGQCDSLQSKASVENILFQLETAWKTSPPVAEPGLVDASDASLLEGSRLMPKARVKAVDSWERSWSPRLSERRRHFVGLFRAPHGPNSSPQYYLVCRSGIAESTLEQLLQLQKTAGTVERFVASASYRRCKELAEWAAITILHKSLDQLGLSPVDDVIVTQMNTFHETNVRDEQKRAIKKMMSFYRGCADTTAAPGGVLVFSEGQDPTKGILILKPTPGSEHSTDAVPVCDGARQGDYDCGTHSNTVELQYVGGVH